MDSSDSDEPEKKRPHLNNNSMCFGYLAQNSIGSPDSKSVDAATLQSQNQKLVQQLDLQKHVLHDFEDKINNLLHKQSSYDDVLITVNQLWNQLVDDLVLLGIRAGPGKKSLQPLSFEAYSRGKIPSCAAKDIFICRLLELDSIESRENDESLVYIKESLSLRHSSTQVLMKVLEDSIELQKLQAEKINEALTGNQSAEDASINLGKIDNLMKEEANHLNEVIGVLHTKHKEYADEMHICISNHSADQSEIKRLAGEVEESMGELEESRRKLVNLQMQKGIISLTTSSSSPRVQTSLPFAATTPPQLNGNLSPEKHADRSMGFREFKDSIEETKILAADRLSELQESQEDNKTLSKQLHELQNELKEDKYIYSSRSYTLLNDQLHHLNSELEHYKMHTDSLQADRSSVLRREKEVTLKADSADAVRKAVMNAESKIGELEHQLQKCIHERNELEIKMEEAVQDSGRKDIKTEFQVMASALSKEIGMMEAQLNRWKETAHEALSLREQSQSLKSLLARKTSEQKNLTAKCAEQAADIKSLKTLIEKLQKDKEELQIILDMFGQQIYDNREITEIKESEERAKSQERRLSNALEEHGLELRVRSANEAESACQRRLSAAEAEILDLRAKLDASERDVLELKEAIKIKDGVAESYISEIETIGQAYEDMQTQHQHLLQQVTERDDYNIKLVSESVKAKQAQNSLVSEKQVLEKQFQQIYTSLGSMKTRIDHSEIQMKKQIAEALKYSQEDRRLAINLETVKRELGDAEKELKWFKSALTSSEKENDQIRRKTEEIQKDLDGQRKARKKIDEEMGEWSRKVEELTLETGEAAIQKLQDEIKDCKSMLKCGVCFDRPKEVVIVKCYHLFCNACIQRNLEIRHRKCPGCGTAFGQSDVRPVKI